MQFLTRGREMGRSRREWVRMHPAIGRQHPVAVEEREDGRRPQPARGAGEEASAVEGRDGRPGDCHGFVRSFRSR